MVMRWLEKQYTDYQHCKRVVEEYSKTFKDADRVLEDLRRFCLVYDTTHVPNDSHSTAINEGRRQVYLHLVHMLETSVDDLKSKPKGNTDERDAERPAD